ncbi:carbamoyltransferase C-terminal domain-containing protein [Bacillus sp. UNCCL81]|uniref:carbamoyltransferase family protein n=1 Tax=Bacillus sp. UNCCL81 TaxID=1502755 RepID=UPI0003F5E065|nr:carbamoyltransferase C-terminal domain-containing protein [Bacillus sp. UNCCL81]SFD61290.1 carbamoyltransferase [Bacillus sp. UNCCL81]
MNILGLLSNGDNPAACLIENGKLTFFAEEERFCRIKKAPNRRPINAIKAALEWSKLKISDIDHIAIGWDNNKYPNYMNHFYKQSFNDQDIIGSAIQSIQLIEYNPELEKRMLAYALKSGGIEGDLPQVSFYSHHLSHAASAYYLSGFKEAIVVALDAHGEENTTVIYRGQDHELIELEKYVQPESLGWFYSAFTEFLGLKANSGEGKVMGLAPFGSANMKIRNKLDKVLWWEEEKYKIDSSYICQGKREYSQRFTDKLILEFGSPRTPESEILQYHMDLAYEVQRKLEEIVVKIVNKYVKLTGIRDICISGGIGMNCKMNGEIHQLPEVDRLFLNPASNDAGTAIGAALLCCKDLHISPLKNKLEHAYWGPEYSDIEIEKIILNNKLNYRYVENIEKFAGEQLHYGKIIAWFQGRMEFGSRSLGNRSILANPTIPEMKDKVNGTIKYREYFRPFAPSIMEEYQQDYLYHSFESPFMIVADYINNEKKALIPSVVHVDSSIRHQTVSKGTNYRYWSLINEFYKLSKVPVLLNTSFNVRGEPIVCSPQDAIRCFYGTGLDILIMGNYVIEKNNG